MTDGLQTVDSISLQSIAFNKVNGLYYQGRIQEIPRRRGRQPSGGGAHTYDSYAPLISWKTAWNWENFGFPFRGAFNCRVRNGPDD